MVPNTLKWALAVSMLGNAFLLGVGWNMLDHDRGPHHPPPPNPAHLIEEMSRDLSAADAEILRQAFVREQPFLEQGRHNPHQMHERIRDALLADPFQPERLTAVFADEDHRRADEGDAIARLLVDAASHMSPQGRRHLADFRPGPPPR